MIKPNNKVRESVVDDSMYDTLLLCRQASPVVDAYIENKEYLSHIEEDDVTYNLLLQEATTILLDEIHEMGVEFTCELSEIYENIFRVELVALLRVRFDGDSFLKVLGVLAETTVQRIESYLTTAIDEDEHDEVLNATIKLVHESMPSFHTWKTLLDYQDLTLSNHKLTAHLSAVLAKYHNSPDDTVVDSFNTANVGAILAKMEQEHGLYEHNIRLAAKNDLTLNRIELFSTIDTFHGDLARHPEVPFLAGTVLPEHILAHHRKTQPHHIEYYVENEDEEVTVTAITTIIAAMVSDSSITDHKVEVEKLFSTEVAITDAVRTKALQLSRILIPASTIRIVT